MLCTLYITLISFITFVNVSSSTNQGDGIGSRQTADLAEAIEYLNKVRAKPAAFTKEIGVDLNNVKPRAKLIWNDTLALVAMNKARDMAKRNYVAHVDPDGNGINIKIFEAGYYLSPAFLREKNANYFESLGAGYSSPLEAIRGLIVDIETDPPGHRIHLLGMDDFWSNCTEIGIGFVKGDSTNEYPFYCCVIIAKHDF